MLLKIQTREKIQAIIRRIYIHQEIIFQERIFVENQAKNSSYILAWLKRAISLKEGMVSKIKKVLMGLFNLSHLMA